MLSQLALLGVVFGAGVGGITVAIVGHESKRDLAMWREAADALGFELVSGFTESRRIEGRLDGVEVTAAKRGVDASASGGAPTKTFAAMARVRLPLPPGLQVRRMTQAERTMPLLTATDRRRIASISDVRVLADDTPGARELFSRHRVRNELVKIFSGRDDVYLFGDRLSFQHSYLGAADIQLGIESTVQAVQDLERALAWDPQPDAGRARRVESRPLVAFGVEPPAPVEPSPPSLGSGRAGRGGDPSALLERMVGELRAEGTDDDEQAGAFTIDREAALRKLAERRLDDPAAFVLDLLRSVELVGATRIEVRHDADELWVRFDGRGFTRRELEVVYGSAFASSPDRRVQACRHLALAIDGAVGLGAQEIVVRGAAGQLRRRVDDEEVADGVERSGTLGNEFYLRLPRRLRRGRLTPVIALVRSRAPVMALEVQIDGEVVPRLSESPGWGYTPFHADGRHGSEHPIRGWVAFELHERSDDGEAAYGEAYVGRHGVWIERRRLPHAPRRLRAVVMSGDLTTDLSGRRLVDDDELRRALAATDRAVQVAIVRAVGQLHARRRDGKAVPARVEAWMRGLCLRGLGKASVRRGVAGELDDARERLLDASVWPTVTGRRTSLRKLGREARRARALPCVDVSLPALVGVERGAVLADEVTAVIPGHALDVSSLVVDEREFLRGIFNDVLESQTTRLLDLVAARSPSTAGSSRQAG